jgi:hypothetical protein
MREFAVPILLVNSIGANLPEANARQSAIGVNSLQLMSLDF